MNWALLPRLPNVTARGISFSTIPITALLALGAIGCGVKVTDGALTPISVAEAGSSTTFPSSETTTPQTDGPDTTKPGDSSSGSLYPPEAKEAIRQQLAIEFEAIGLNDKKATCLADAYVERFGTDISNANNVTELRDLLKSCKISISDLGG